MLGLVGEGGGIGVLQREKNGTEYLLLNLYRLVNCAVGSELKVESQRHPFKGEEKQLRDPGLSRFGLCP